MNIANSNFENWRKQNPTEDINKFDFQLNKMGVSGALFDMVKLLDVSKTVISKYTADEIYADVSVWAKQYDEELANLIADKEYALKIFGIERGNVKPRKDIAKWSDVKNSIIYMFDDKFFNSAEEYNFQKINDKEEIKNIVETYVNKYFDSNDTKETWFNKIKELSGELGYAKEVKEYKQEPDKYKGHVGDVSTVLRVVLTKRQNTPDLYEIMNVLGKESVEKRFKEFIDKV